MRIFSTLQRFFRTPKGLLLLVLVLLSAIAIVPAGARHLLPGVVGAVAAAMVVDVAIVRLWRGVWFFPSGAILSGLIVALILSPAVAWYVPVATAAFAVASKYLLRTRQGHIFNPAALALVAAYFLFASGQDWWGALPDLPMPFVLVLLATGLFIADRVNKLPMVLIFTGAYFLLFAAYAYAGDPARVAEVFRAPDVNAALFFAFFMLTDPPTSPARYRDQAVFGLIVALMGFAVFVILGAVYFLLAGLLVGNVWEVWRRMTARSRAPQRPTNRVSRPPDPRSVVAATPHIRSETGNNRRA
ncbi:MAG: RnfABCDGE type electron transport complex subunit D [Chloroflexota bacterium]|nr:RnfABCDGE type electron transport complex subunit D [Chloroflexota bacterium]